MKKILLGLSASTLALFGTAAFTHAEGAWINGDTSTKIEVENHSGAVVTTEAISNANTGGNTADARSKSHEGSSRATGGNIMTGDATAETQVMVDANTNKTIIDAGCGCAVSRDGDLTTKYEVENKNFAWVTTAAASNADTGNNTADAKSKSHEGSSRAKGGNIMTGMADAFTGVGVVVNTNKTWIQ